MEHANKRGNTQGIREHPILYSEYFCKSKTALKNIEGKY